jgi:hypothetical protein
MPELSCTNRGQHRATHYHAHIGDMTCHLRSSWLLLRKHRYAWRFVALHLVVAIPSPVPKLITRILEQASSQIKELCPSHRLAGRTISSEHLTAVVSFEVHPKWRVEYLDLFVCQRQHG